MDAERTVHVQEVAARRVTLHWLERSLPDRIWQALPGAAPAVPAFLWTVAIVPGAFLCFMVSLFIPGVTA